MDIFSYFSPAQRPIILGEEIVNSNRIISIGTLGDKIMALVVRSTSYSQLPHEVTLEGVHLEVNNWVGRCTCKAGSGEKCKHISAALIYINR